MSIDFIIGIDVGVKGAYCVIDNSDGKITTAKCFTLIEKTVPNSRRGKKKTRIEKNYDRRAMINEILPYAENTVAYVELVHSRPHEGVASSFKFGSCRGQIEMMLTALGIPMIIVTSQEWQKTFHSQKERSEGIDPKIRSRNAYLKYIDQFGGDIHDGIIDATLIAEHGRRRMADGLDKWRFK